MPTPTRDMIETVSSLMNEHGLSHWGLEWTNLKTEAGSCYYQQQTLRFSVPLWHAMPEAQRRDTVLHEIAHAIAGAAAGHGLAWKAVALKVGASPRPSFYDQATSEAIANWVGTCPRGHKRYAIRLTDKTRNRISCGKCSRFYSPDYRFTWERAR